MDRKVQIIQVRPHVLPQGGVSLFAIRAQEPLFDCNMSTVEVVAHGEQGSGSKADEPKNAAMGEIEVMDVEDGEQKSYYSKTSVIMNVVFSTLAIGSDGL